MKTDDKIRKYLDGELIPEELSAFEKEMENSPELKMSIENFRSTIKSYRDISSSDLQKNYFNNIIPEFRKSIEKKSKKSFSPAYAFGSIFVIIITAAIIFFMNKDGSEIQESNDVFAENMLGNEIIIYLSSDYSNYDLLDEDDFIIDSLLSSELNLSAANFDLQYDFANINFNSIFNNLSDEDFDGLYSELISKKF